MVPGAELLVVGQGVIRYAANVVFHIRIPSPLQKRFLDGGNITRGHIGRQLGVVLANDFWMGKAPAFIIALSNERKQYGLKAARRAPQFSKR